MGTMSVAPGLQNSPGTRAPATGLAGLTYPGGRRHGVLRHRCPWRDHDEPGNLIKPFVCAGKPLVT